MVRMSERVLRWSVYKGREVDVLELVFLLLIGLSSLLQIAGNTQPGSISLLLPHAFRTTWLIILSLGSFAAVLGIFWPRQQVDAILFEISGLTAVFVGLVIYGAAQIVTVVINHSSSGSAMSGALVILIGLGFGFKALRLQGVIERLKKQ